MKHSPFVSGQAVSSNLVGSLPAKDQFTCEATRPLYYFKSVKFYQLLPEPVIERKAGCCQRREHLLGMIDLHVDDSHLSLRRLREPRDLPANAQASSRLFILTGARLQQFLAE